MGALASADSNQLFLSNSGTSKSISLGPLKWPGCGDDLSRYFLQRIEKTPLEQERGSRTRAVVPHSRYEVNMNPPRSDRQYSLCFVKSCKQTMRSLWSFAQPDRFHSPGGFEWPVAALFASAGDEKMIIASACRCGAGTQLYFLEG